MVYVQIVFVVVNVFLVVGYVHEYQKPNAKILGQATDSRKPEAYQSPLEHRKGQLLIYRYNDVHETLIEHLRRVKSRNVGSTSRNLDALML